MSQPLVNIRSLTKTFGDGATRVEAVRGLDLELERGKIVLVMGPSGSGKTTFLSMLGGLLRTTAGEIWIDETNIAILTERELPPFRARTFGFIFQDFNLIAALSRRRTSRSRSTSPVSGQAGDGRARQLLESMGLADRLDFPVEKLSGGEKQRVAIARAIANRPTLILADEPTANLDSAHGAETMRLLRRLAKEEGTTVVIVSHDERLRAVADRVLWLEDGQLKALAALVRDPLRDAARPAAGAGIARGGRLAPLLLLARLPTSTSRSAPAPTAQCLARQVPLWGIVGGEKGRQCRTKTYSVPSIHCGHCEAAVTRSSSTSAAFIPSRSISRHEARHRRRRWPRRRGARCGDRRGRLRRPIPA